jgi:hypothetical protein
VTEQDRDVDFGAADEEGVDEDAVEIGAENLRSREDLDLRVEVRELRRKYDETQDLLYQALDRIDELESRIEDEGIPDYVSEVEQWARQGKYDGLRAYEERVTKIWAELPKYAMRTKSRVFATEDKQYSVVYSLDYNRLRDALAAVDPGEWQSGEKVKSGQAAYARDVFEEKTPAVIDDAQGGNKVVVVSVRKWSLERPETVARRLMNSADVEKFVDEVNL